jgi:hypothetical protein
MTDGTADAGGSAGSTNAEGGAGGNGGRGSGGDFGVGARGGGAGPRCGGMANIRCDDDLYCVFPDRACGTESYWGECWRRPSECPEDCPGVRGCDTRLYCNACVAAWQGVDVVERGSP